MKKILTGLLAVVMAAMLCACGATKDGAALEEAYNGSADYSGFNSGSEYDSKSDTTGENSGSGETGNVDYQKKLIFTYNLCFQTTDYDKSYAYIESKVAEYGGYIESSDEYGSDLKHANLTLRIPADKAEDFLKETGSIGTVTSKSKAARDVTRDYYDLKSHIETLQTKRARLLELLEQAESVADIMEIESQISDCEYEINSYTQSLKLYDNLVDYVTIYMSLDTVRDITVVDEDSSMVRIQKGFMTNLHDAWAFLVDGVIWLITSIPFIVLMCFFALIIFLIIRLVLRIEKRNKKKRVDKKSGEVINVNNTEERK